MYQWGNPWKRVGDRQTLIYLIFLIRSNIELPPILSLYYDVHSAKGPNVRRSAQKIFAMSSLNFSSNAILPNETLIESEEQVTDDDLIQNFTTGWKLDCGGNFHKTIKINSLVFK